MNTSYTPILSKLQKESTLLMCPPDHFKLLTLNHSKEYPNDMTKKHFNRYQEDPIFFCHKAFTQWSTLYELLLQLGISIELLKPSSDLPDQVFTADASLSINSDNKDITIFSNFSYLARNPETTFHRKKLSELFSSRKFISSPYLTEGTGDNIYDPFRDIFWSGYTNLTQNRSIADGRSDIRSHTEIKKKTNINVQSMKVNRPFFHLDTTMMPLSRGHIVYYPNGLDDTSKKALTKQCHAYHLDPKEYLIEVNAIEAQAFACNIICLGNHVILSSCGERLPKILRKKNYNVHPIDVTQFLAGGGGPHCLTNNIKQQRIEGGLVNYQN